MNQEILDQTIQIIKSHSPDAHVEAATLFIEDLGFDSIRLMDILGDIEDHFDVSIPLKNLPNIQTIEDTVRFLETLLEK